MHCKRRRVAARNNWTGDGFVRAGPFVLGRLTVKRTALALGLGLPLAACNMFQPASSGNSAAAPDTITVNGVVYTKLGGTPTPGGSPGAAPIVAPTVAPAITPAAVPTAIVPGGGGDPTLNPPPPPGGGGGMTVPPVSIPPAGGGGTVPTTPQSVPPVSGGAGGHGG